MKHYIGLMSGTSLDGVDAVCLSVDDEERMKVSAPWSHPLSASLRQECQALQSPSHNDLARAETTAINVAKLYAEAVNGLLAREGLSKQSITAIGAHGQTIRHCPHWGWSKQILNAAHLAELTELPVAYDFRARDIVAGGQGAPLIPAFHRALAHTHAAIKTERAWAFLNLGGMANFSVGVGDLLLGADCGPANVLIDAWWREHFPNATPYDEGGRWAQSGRVDEPLLAALMAHPFVKKMPPKSCGYEEFNLSWLHQVLAQNGGAKIPPPDVQATLIAFSAQAIAQCWRDLLWPINAPKNAPKIARIWVFGGGVHNDALIQAISQAINKIVPALGDPITLLPTDHLDIPPQAMEAAAFAWLAHRRMSALPANVPSVTGAVGERILGALTL